jgi:TatD DNase family protein
LLDSHCHVNELVYGSANAVEKVIRRAQKNGVNTIITIGSGFGIKASEQAVQIANRFTNVYATVGIHPHDAKIWDDGIQSKLFTLASDRKVVALGEMGLDFYYENSTKDQQRRIFRRQIDIANELELPIVIHDRVSAGETIEILKQKDAFDHGVLFHCFSGTTDEMREIVDLGGYISIPGIVTFKNSFQMVDVVRDVPIERLMVETDSPFLTPEPHRGKNNEPSYLPFVIQKVADILKSDHQVIADITEENAKRFFAIP